MSETTSVKTKAAFGASFAAKAAAFALAVSIAVFLAAYLAATVPDKFSGWETALPARGMDAVQAESAALRARYLHEAAVRPQLIRAGFLSPQELETKRGRYRSHRELDLINSQALLDVLWAMRVFPELHKTFLGMLLDGESPLQERAQSFHIYGGFLAAQAHALAHDSRADFSRRDFDFSNGTAEDRKDWFEYYGNDPLVRAHSENGRMYVPRKADPTEAAKAAAIYDGKLALARRMLPVILASVQAEMAARNAKNDAQDKAEDDPDGNARNNYRDEMEYLDDISEPIAAALNTMWEHRDDSSFLTRAGNIVASNEGTFLQRYEAVPLMVEKPGLSVAEYVFWQKYKQDLASVTGCVGTSPRHYGYILGCMGKLMPVVTGMLKAQGTFILGGQTGPGVAITRTETFTPARNLSGSLYLLADMQLAMKDAPEYDFSRAVPIFRGTLFRHMVNQPLVMPLSPKNPKDAAILKWYQEKGWSEGRTLLFSAVGAPEEVARHWSTVHLLWWPDKKKNADADPDLAYYHPVSGHFMSGILPELKGAGVSRFLGPITGLWFGRWNVDKTGWVAEKYEARPEEAPRALAARHEPPRSALYEWLTDNKPENAEKPADATAAAPKAARPGPVGPPTILLGREILNATGISYRYNYRVTLARHLDEKFHDAASSPMDVFSFTDNAVTMLNEWAINHKDQVDPAAEYLWRFRNDPVVEKRVREILAQEELSPYERLRKVRRALGLPEIKKDRGC